MHGEVWQGWELGGKREGACAAFMIGGVQKDGIGPAWMEKDGIGQDSQYAVEHQICARLGASSPSSPSLSHTKPHPHTILHSAPPRAADTVHHTTPSNSSARLSVAHT